MTISAFSRVAVMVAVSVLLWACAGGGARGGESGSPGTSPGPADPGQRPDPNPTDPGQRPDPDPTGPGTGPGWGRSRLLPVAGVEDDFQPALPTLVRAARATPRGASQASLTRDGQTAHEVSAHFAGYQRGQALYQVNGGASIFLHAPGPRPGFRLALFTNLPPGIEPDLSSYRHEVLGLWARDDGAIGAFWDMSPRVPPVDFGPRSPTGAASYEGDAVGLHATAGEVTKFLADVTLVADFDRNAVSGRVDGFRSPDGKAFDGLRVQLGEAGFSRTDAPFSGDTTSGRPGAGKWGARWSDGGGSTGWTMGGTFGFAAADESMALLGAFTACSCASIASGSPQRPGSDDTSATAAAAP